jgi:phosphotransferase system  glucose/maltose/N-acetylglucosamine-specific IIC component
MIDVYRFLKYNVVFALLPLVIVWGMRALANKSAPLSAYVPELLFLAIMVSITAIGDIGDYRQRISTWLRFDIIQSTLLMGVILAVALYAAYTYDSLTFPEGSVFRTNVTIVTAVLAPLLCLAGITAEVLLARVKGSTP